jgi:RNA polymerase sigma-70 factor, ECF subfamily
MADAVVRLDSMTDNPRSSSVQDGLSGVSDSTQVVADAVPTSPSRLDLALVERLQAGAEEAYEELIHLYQVPVYNLVYRLLADPGDSCDVVQEVFLKIFRNVGNFRGQSSLKTWIYRIALNEAHNRRRWFSRHRKHEIDLDRDDEHLRSLQETIPDAGFSPFDLLLGTETQEKIEDALQRLSPNFREAVVLRDIEELTYDEIAEILNISMGTVKSRILRGREALRKQLMQGGEQGVWTAVRGMASGD